MLSIKHGSVSTAFLRKHYKKAYRYVNEQTTRKVKKMVTLSILEKTRLINKLLQNSVGQYVDYKEISEALKDIIHANITVTDDEGKILVSLLGR